LSDPQAPVTQETGEVIERLAERGHGQCQHDDRADGPRDECDFCLADAARAIVEAHLTAQPAPSGWQERIAAMEQEIAELRRMNNVALCQSCTRLREIARDSEVFCTIVYDLTTGEVRHERPEGQNAVDALPPAPEVKDPIASAVRAELQPLEDALIDVGHRLAKQASPDTCDDLCMLPAPEGEAVRCPERPFECVVHRAGKTDPPQDCDWPFCGCDEHALKVIATLQECGWGPQP